MRRKSFIALALLSASVCAGHATAAPVRWEVNGHYYEAVSFARDVTAEEIALAIAAVGQEYAVIGEDGIGWHEARVIAASRGGYLASIQSQAENDWIFSLIDAPEYWDGGAGPWFGGAQDLASPDYVEPGGAWIWINDYDPTHFEAMEYTNWKLGEPNNMGGYENVTHFCTNITVAASSPYWNDRPSNIPTAGFVVEYVPEPATLSLLAIGGLAVLRRKRK